MLIDILSHRNQCVHVQLLHVNADGIQEPQPHILPFPQNSEQNVLRSCHLALILLCKPVAVLQHTRGSWRIPVAFKQCDVSLRCDKLLYHADQLHFVHTVLRKHSRGNTCLFLDKPHQNMLTPYIALMQILCSLGGFLKRHLCFICKLLHFSMPPCHSLFIGNYSVPS